MNALLRSADIHARVSWPAVLVQLGIDPSYVRLKKSGPCPACNGKDRFTFDDRNGRGDFICRGCGAGNGFDLLMRVFGWDFREARRRTLEAAGITGSQSEAAASFATCTHARARTSPEPHLAHPMVAQPSRRIRALIGSSCALSDCSEAVQYLTGRNLWPLPDAIGIRGHVAADYFEDGNSIGKFAAIVAPLLDINGQLVSAHVTYLQGGTKLVGHEPRKLLGKTTGRTGCAVRLMPAAEILGIAEGIETALSAASIDRLPVWAALNTALLAKFEPPAQVRTLRIYADRDAPGLLAACQLMERLQGRVQLEVRVPEGSHKDFNDQLAADKYAGKIP